MAEIAYKNYIAGEWVSGEAHTENINPSDVNDLIGRATRGTREDTKRAIDIASEVQPVWAKTSPVIRAEILDKIGQEIIQRCDELGDLLSREEGKTRKEAVAEVNRAGHLFKFFAVEAYRSNSEGYQSLREGVDLEVKREPLGVVGVVTPWNFPMAVPAWKVAPALAYGNSVIFKPAEQVPASAWAMSEIISRSGIPEGVFNLLIGQGSQVGDEIVNSPKVSGVTFTGSTKIGRDLGSQLFLRGGRIQLEMGGKNPLVILDDADLEVAVEAAVQGAYYATGQRCTGTERFIVADKIHDQFLDAITKRLEGLVVDDARKDGTDIGPVFNQSQLDVDLEYIRLAEEEGAKRVFGGEMLTRETQGYFLSPVLFAETTNEMRINQEEVFGPFASVIRVNDYEEAFALANDSEFGLSSGICTNNESIIRHFVENAQAGMVQVNLPTAGMDFHAPFTGRKASSYGPPEKGAYCREFFTTAKVVHAKRPFVKSYVEGFPA